MLHSLESYKSKDDGACKVRSDNEKNKNKNCLSVANYFDREGILSFGPDVKGDTSEYSAVIRAEKIHACA